MKGNLQKIQRLSFYRYKNSRSVLRLTVLFLFMGLVCSCEKKRVQEVSLAPQLFPDYAGVTIPCNIAPLCFEVAGCDRFHTTFFLPDGSSWSTNSSGYVSVGISSWRKLLNQAVGDTLRISLEARQKERGDWVRFPVFWVAVSPDSIDSHVVYRLIYPGYESWGEMGIYQRELASFEEKPLLENKEIDYGCVNCHAFPDYDPTQFQLHARSRFEGTLLVHAGKAERLAMQSHDGAFAGYPAWHPSGKYIAYAVAKTRQEFYAAHSRKIEVFDLSSDLLLYDVEKRALIEDSMFYGTERLETFPHWSPGGDWLYFSFTQGADSILPGERCYAIARIAFDVKRGCFVGKEETVVDFREQGFSLLFPRLSPDGRFLLFTKSKGGAFPIWNQEADLEMIDLQQGCECDLSLLNSSQAESYHSWSSSGKWMVFSSRRIDGLYTRLYFVHFDEAGVPAKPFLLPQSNPEENRLRMRSYNIPEWSCGAVSISNIGALLRQKSQKVEILSK